MGLDIALGALILMAGIRGWFRGFLVQILQVAALVGCIYLAEPVRDLARPYLQQYLAGIQPEILDKLLWWTAAVTTYIVTMGISGMLVKVYRRKAMEEFDSNRGDQGLGFLVGALKGAVIVSFAAAGISSYAPAYLKAGGWVARQVETSRSLVWSKQYQPAKQIWNAAPVQAVVARVRTRGLGLETTTPTPSTESGPDAISTALPELPKRQAERPEAESDPVRTASRLPKLAIPSPIAPLNPDSPDFLNSVDHELDRAGIPRSPGAVDRE